MSISLTFPKCTTDMSIVMLSGGPEKKKTILYILVFWTIVLYFKILEGELSIQISSGAS